MLILRIYGDWYGHFHYQTNEEDAPNPPPPKIQVTYLYDHLYQITKDQIFKLENADQKAWKRVSDDDNKVYYHIDGAFFETKENSNQPAVVTHRYFAQQRPKLFHTGRFIVNTDRINNYRAESAYVSKDLSNYNLYLYTASTHDYTEDEPIFWKQPQTCASCYLIAMNNLMQFEIWTEGAHGSFQDELNRQFELLSEEDRGKADKIAQYKINPDNGGIKGDMIEQITSALKFNFNVKVESISFKHNHGGANADKVTIGRDKEIIGRRQPTVPEMLEQRIIGYLVLFEFKAKNGKVWLHWIAIKYFNGVPHHGWYAFDGNALGKQSDPMKLAESNDDVNKGHGFFKGNSFADVYDLVWHYWTVKKEEIITENTLFKCTSNEGSDHAGQNQPAANAKQDYWDKYNVGSNENMHVIPYNEDHQHRAKQSQSQAQQFIQYGQLSDYSELSNDHDGDYVSNNEWLVVIVPTLLIGACLFGMICMIVMGFGGWICYREGQRANYKILHQRDESEIC